MLRLQPVGVLYNLLQGDLQIIPVCDGDQVSFPVKVLENEGTSSGELLPDSMLELSIRDLASHVHGASLVVQLDFGLEDIRLRPLLPRSLLLLGSCCVAVGCG